MQTLPPDITDRLQTIINELRGISKELEALNNKPMASEPAPPQKFSFRVQLSNKTSITAVDLTRSDVEDYVSHYRRLSYDHNQMEVIDEQTGQPLHVGNFWGI